MAGLDWLVIAIYFLIMAAIVLWSSKKQNTSADYFLAGRNIGWFAIGGSLFASNIGSEHIVGLAGSGAMSGMAMAHWEMHAWIMLMLGWIFVPFYYKANVFTMPEFLEKRFNKYVRWILTVVSLVAYVFTKISVTVYAGALVFQTILPDININLFGYTWGPFWIGAFVTVIVTGVYTILGGFRAVLYTDSIQALLLIIGSLSITLIGLDALGGWNELVIIASERSNELALWRPLIIEGSDLPWWKNNDFPWLGIMIASPIIGIWYWCTDQYIVQRTLAANNIKIGRRGAIFGAYLKLLPIFIFLIPGIIAFALSIQNPEVFSIEKADRAFPMLVKTLLPVGLKGLVAGGLMAALMSSLASVFNSCSTIFTIDIYKKLKPNESEKKLLNIGKLATTVIVILGIIWIPIMEKIGGGVMYQYLQNVQSYIAPPVAAVFILGIVWKRVNSKAAITTLMAGLILLIMRLSSEIYFQPEISSNTIVDSYMFIFATINFSHMAILMFMFSILLCVGVTLSTTEPEYSKIVGLSFGTLTKEQRLENKNSYETIDVILSVSLVIIVVAILSYFTG